MADGTVIGLAITTFSSMVLGGGALWRSMRQDTQNADKERRRSQQVQTDAAVAALQKQVDLLLVQADGHIKSEALLRSEVEGERRERAASEDRLRREHAAAQDRLFAQIRTLEIKVERCEAERADLIRELATATGHALPAGQEDTNRDRPPPT